MSAFGGKAVVQSVGTEPKQTAAFGQKRALPLFPRLIPNFTIFVITHAFPDSFVQLDSELVNFFDFDDSP